MAASTAPADLRTHAARWLEIDPDPETRAQIQAMLDADDLDALGLHFGSRIEFGTAGLRAPRGPGSNRMNRVIVRQTAAALARHLGAGATFVVARDARYGSKEYAEDTARVLAAAGCHILLLDQPVITPVLAFAVHRLEAAAGVMVTASHNPAADNGYKMYDAEGIQIVPPTDVAVQAAINEILVEGGDPPLAPADHPAIESVPVDLDAGVVGAYLDAALRCLRTPADRGIRAVQTSLHGVADPFFREAFRRAGFPPLEVVASQAQPDPDFPTVSFPNPEEPGALDAAFELAAACDADVVLANDPDGDRLAVGIPTADGWRRLAGDETGTLLADHLLNATSGSSRMVVRTVVSSHMLDRMAEHHGVESAVTLTGTKWIPRPALERPDVRFLFGYEEALGYVVSGEIREKDGVAAALLMAEIAAGLAAEGRTIQDRLDDLATTFGLHYTGHLSIRLEGPDPTAARNELMERLRSSPATELAGTEVVRTRDLLDDPELPSSNVLIFELAGGSWVAVRPSGTEPKVKVYAEALVPVEDRAELDAARATGSTRIDTLLTSIQDLL